MTLATDCAGRYGDDDIRHAPVPATTDDRPPGNHEDHELRLEYYAADFDYEWSIALAAVNAGHNEVWLRKVLQTKGPYYDYVLNRPLPFGGKQKA